MKRTGTLLFAMMMSTGLAEDIIN